MKLSRGSLVVILIALVVLLIGVVQVIARGMTAEKVDLNNSEASISCPAGTPSECPVEDADGVPCTTTGECPIEGEKK